MRLCNGPPKSTCRNSSSVPATIFSSSAPTLLMTEAVADYIYAPDAELMTDEPKLLLKGGGKGGGFEIEKGMPCVDEDNFCRQRCCCYDGGCRAWHIQCQTLCVKFKYAIRIPELTTTFNLPCTHHDNFCRCRCCCMDQGCTKLEPICQVFLSSMQSLN